MVLTAKKGTTLKGAAPAIDAVAGSSLHGSSINQQVTGPPTRPFLTYPIFDLVFGVNIGWVGNFFRVVESDNMPKTSFTLSQYKSVLAKLVEDISVGLNRTHPILGNRSGVIPFYIVGELDK